MYVLCLKTKNFCVYKTTKYSKLWTRDSQCQDGCCSLAENTPNAPQIFAPIRLPKPKSLGFSKKSSLWMSVVIVIYCTVGDDPLFLFILFQTKTTKQVICHRLHYGRSSKSLFNYTKARNKPLRKQFLPLCVTLYMRVLVIIKTI